MEENLDLATAYWRQVVKDRLSFVGNGKKMDDDDIDCVVEKLYDLDCLWEFIDETIDDTVEAVEGKPIYELPDASDGLPF